jgi:hypothetical protein
MLKGSGMRGQFQRKDCSTSAEHMLNFSGRAALDQRDIQKLPK